MDYQHISIPKHKIIMLIVSMADAFLAYRPAVTVMGQSTWETSKCKWTCILKLILSCSNYSIIVMKKVGWKFSPNLYKYNMFYSILVFINWNCLQNLWKAGVEQRVQSKDLWYFCGQVLTLKIQIWKVLHTVQK